MHIKLLKALFFFGSISAIPIYAQSTIAFGNNTTDLVTQLTSIATGTDLYRPIAYSNKIKTIYTDVYYLADGYLTANSTIPYSNYSGLKTVNLKSGTQASFNQYSITEPTQLDDPLKLTYSTGVVNGYLIGGTINGDQFLKYDNTGSAKFAHNSYVQIRQFQKGEHVTDHNRDFFKYTNVCGGYVFSGALNDDDAPKILKYGDNGTLKAAVGAYSYFAHYQEFIYNAGIYDSVYIPQASVKGFVTMTKLKVGASPQDLPFKSGVTVPCATGTNIEIVQIHDSTAVNPVWNGWVKRFTLASTTVLPKGLGGTLLTTFYAGDVISVGGDELAFTSTPDRRVTGSIPTR